MTLLDEALLAFIGLAWGIAVGSGFVAFITVLDIVPRLVQLTGTPDKIRVYEMAIISGVILFTWIDFREWLIGLTPWIIPLLGGAMGIFVGMLAAALTEVVNVIPILAKRLGVQDRLMVLLIMMALGKVAGSLIQSLFSII
ncbi:stage V sporulation protein AB [Staphylospora marina]|uniref:stage V sporulation protein AB n=1 Tax=Staphylospora marina TaxID=2490858 RepID=UPI000F5BE04E|nr:stage V sporulation protein AB [Staphylospora marina]